MHEAQQFVNCAANQAHRTVAVHLRMRKLNQLCVFISFFFFKHTITKMWKVVEDIIIGGKRTRHRKGGNKTDYAIPY